MPQSIVNGLGHKTKQITQTTIGVKLTVKVSVLMDEGFGSAGIEISYFLLEVQGE
jgi:hypothetical protein